MCVCVLCIAGTQWERCHERKVWRRISFWNRIFFLYFQLPLFTPHANITEGRGSWYICFSAICWFEIFNLSAWGSCNNDVQMIFKFLKPTLPLSFKYFLYLQHDMPCFLKPPPFLMWTALLQKIPQRPFTNYASTQGGRGLNKIVKGRAMRDVWLPKSVRTNSGCSGILLN